MEGHGSVIDIQTMNHVLTKLNKLTLNSIITLHIASFHSVFPSVLGLKSGGNWVLFPSKYALMQSMVSQLPSMISMKKLIIKQSENVNFNNSRDRRTRENEIEK